MYQVNKCKECKTMLINTAEKWYTADTQLGTTFLQAMHWQMKCKTALHFWQFRRIWLWSGHLMHNNSVMGPKRTIKWFFLPTKRVYINILKSRIMNPLQSQEASQCNAKTRFSTTKHLTPKQWPRLCCPHTYLATLLRPEN